MVEWKPKEVCLTGASELTGLAASDLFAILAYSGQPLKILGDFGQISKQIVSRQSVHPFLTGDDLFANLAYSGQRFKILADFGQISKLIYSYISLRYYSQLFYNSVTILIW